MLPIVEDLVKQLWSDFKHPRECYNRFRARWEKLAKEREREVTLGGGAIITDSTTISIVVPAYNEAEHVEDTLRWVWYICDATHVHVQGSNRKEKCSRARCLGHTPVFY